MKYHTENIVSSFFYYMWNTWSKKKCKAVPGGDHPHLWEKWNAQIRDSTYGATERFYIELSECSRTLLVERAVPLYNDKALKEESDGSKVLVCEECGSRQVGTQAWIDANTEVCICDTAHDCDSRWCKECEENVGFCLLEEFKQIMRS